MAILLDKLLKDGAAYEANSDSISNHLPMALYSLHWMGADEACLQRFFAGYSPQLSLKAPAMKAVTGQTWPDVRGARCRHTDLVEFFTAEAGRLGGDALLRRYIPQLMPGVGTAAFHGLIRLSYGIAAANTQEIIEGLALWSDAYCTVPAALSADGAASFSPLARLRQLAAVPGWRGKKWSGHNITDRMQQVALEPAFIRITAGTPRATGSLREIAEACLTLFAATNNFTALHLVTSAHALRLVLPYCPNQAEALEQYWAAAMAAYVSLGCPDARLPALAPAPTWPELYAKAFASSDDHVIKIIWSCAEEDRHYKNPLYAQAAYAYACAKD